VIPFINIDDLQAVVSETLDDNDLQVAIALDSACQIVRDEIHQKINLERDDIEFYDGNGQRGIVLRQMPVLEVTQVMEDDEILVPNEDYIVSPQTGIIWRQGGWWPYRWARGRQNIVITYDHGWAFTEDEVLDLSEPAVDVERVPSSIRQVALALAVRILRAKSVPVGVSGLTGETIGDYSYTRDTAAAGVDTQTTLFPEEIASLDMYRIVGVSQ
jgi:hypothetical protein